MPTVSVMMPVYNCGQYVEQAINSVLNQTYTDFELIIVDDGSDDHTPVTVDRLARRHPDIIRFIRHRSNQGVSAARNTAIAHSKGKYIMSVDGDDIQHPQRLEVTLNALEAHSVDMVFHDCEMIDEHGTPLNKNKGYPAGMDARNGILFQLRRNHLWSGLALMRKTADIQFDTSIRNAVDFELFLRLLLQGYSFHLEKRVLTQYRIHSTNISNNGVMSKNSVQTVLRRIDLNALFSNLAKVHGREEAAIAAASGYLWRDESEDAIRLLEGIPSSAERDFYLGVGYYKLSRLADSLRLFENLHFTNPNPAVWNNIGALGFALNRDANQAVKWLEMALNGQPGYMDAVHNLESVKQQAPDRMKITERPLRESVIHTNHYQL